MGSIREIWKDNLRRLIGKRSLKEVSATSGLNYRTLQNALSGRILHDANLGKLAEALGVQEAELFQDPEHGAHKLRLLERVATLKDDEAKLLLPGFEALLSGLFGGENELKSEEDPDETPQEKDGG